MAGLFRSKGRDFVIDADEIKRYQGRHSPMDVIKKLQSGLPKGETRQPHCCYVQLVGLIPGYNKTEKQCKVADEDDDDDGAAYPSSRGKPRSSYQYRDNDSDDDDNGAAYLSSRGKPRSSYQCRDNDSDDDDKKTAYSSSRDKPHSSYQYRDNDSDDDDKTGNSSSKWKPKSASQNSTTNHVPDHSSNKQPISPTNPSAKSPASSAEKSSLSLANAVLLQDIKELLEQRINYLVFEDNFTPTLAKIVQRDHGQYSFSRLRAICARFETTAAMKQHDERSRRTSEYFTKMVDRKISSDEARAFAFSIAFYTGSQSETINKSTALIVRTTHAEAMVNGRHEEIGEDAAIIMFYLTRALSHIKFYWGTVTRRVQLSVEELKDYKPGVLVTWLQFSSSMKGTEAPTIFQNRNTQFTIKSLTGRSIQYFSNFPDEDEVLFLPHSSFLVDSVDCIDSNYYISMEQVELGLCKYSVLWVDDKIFDENWENKRHMEKASTAGVEINVHFIPKSSTETALAFLKSPFGLRLQHRKTFRIVTDMNRLNEKSPDDAGARFIASVRELKFNTECLVFTGDTTTAEEKITQHIKDSTNREGIKVTQSVADLEKFVNFDMTDSFKASYSKSLCNPS